MEIIVKTGRLGEIALLASKRAVRRRTCRVMARSATADRKVRLTAKTGRFNTQNRTLSQAIAGYRTLSHFFFKGVESASLGSGIQSVPFLDWLAVFFS